ncbi:MAG: DASH family cryptochrome, partial [Bacteroidota bacterium]
MNAVSMDILPGAIPTLDDFGIEAIEQDSRGMQFAGGETNGIERLNHYIWETKKVKDYKQTRNELIGADYSTKFSPWLAQGCLSPKLIYHEVKKYEQEFSANDSTYWVFFELLWRDFFRLIGKKYENKIFQKGGIINRINLDATEDDKLFEAWSQGNTGVPFIDANMRELNRTGFMSNRGRQNVASFLIHQLGLNWQMGAYYFESLLLDYDPCSNYGNWNYLAGVGTDPREDRVFNTLSQAKRYDPHGTYVKHWIPELANLPDHLIHQPHLMSEVEQLQYQVKLGEDYPKPFFVLDE